MLFQDPGSVRTECGKPPEAISSFKCRSKKISSAQICDTRFKCTRKVSVFERQLPPCGPPSQGIDMPVILKKGRRIGFSCRVEKGMCGERARPMENARQGTHGVLGQKSGRKLPETVFSVCFIARAGIYKGFCAVSAFRRISVPNYPRCIKDFIQAINSRADA